MSNFGAIKIIDSAGLPQGVLMEDNTLIVRDKLIETLQELIQRLAPLASVVADVGGASLRVQGLGSFTVSGSVTASGGGYITSAQSIAEKALAGVLYTQRMAVENLTAIHSNINNITAK